MKNLLTSFVLIMSTYAGFSQNTAVKILPNATSPGNSTIIGFSAGITSTGPTMFLLEKKQVNN